MTRAALVLGTGGHARVVLSILSVTGQHHVIGLVELEKPRSNEAIMGIPVFLTPDDLNAFVGRSDLDVFLALGDNSKRHQWWCRLRKLGFNMPNLISPFAIVDRSAQLGDSNVICARVFIGPECRLGMNNLINTSAIIEHEVTIANHCHLAPASTIAGRTRIGNECFIGASSTVIDRLVIADATTLGAGSVLIKSVDQSGQTFVGVPAKSLGLSL